MAPWENRRSVIGVPNAKTDLRVAQAGAQRLRHQVVKRDDTRLEARRVQVREVITNHVDRGRMRG